MFTVVQQRDAARRLQEADAVREGAPDPRTRTLDRAVSLVRKGLVSKASALLLSGGVALVGHETAGKLALASPPHKGHMHSGDPRLASPPTVPTITLEQSNAAMRHAKRGFAAGPSRSNRVCETLCIIYILSRERREGRRLNERDC